MILDAEIAARKYAEVHVKGARVSVAAIQTSQPKYLIFGDDSQRPLCVVQFGERAELERVYGVLRMLHPLLPDTVPAPFACEQWRGKVYVFVQGGLDGLPWFELQRRCQSSSEWLRLERCALAGLRELQNAVRAVTAPLTLNPANELRDVLRRVLEQGISLSDGLVAAVEGAADDLLPLGNMRCWAQHGDYSLNNVLLGARDKIRIIDFEEFGLTCMPMQDEIGLAVSMAALAPASCSKVPLDAYLREISPDRPTFSHTQDAALVMYYLLWRISLTHGVPRRAASREWLTSVLERRATRHRHR
jgi:hypothetical protein